MCLIAFAWRVHPRYPLILVANRDEYHARPTAALGAWPEDPAVIGGRDLRAGGSWLGLRRGGRLAAVTNVRGPDVAPAPRSRGALVRNFLCARSAAGASCFAAGLRAASTDYGGFNLLLCDGREMVWAGNRPIGDWRVVEPGVHAVSNGKPSFIDGKPWPKVRRAIDGLTAWLDRFGAGLPAAPEAIDSAPLLRQFADERGAADPELPDTGVGIEIERRLAPIFIRGTEYGTRCTSVALIADNGAAALTERGYGADAVCLDTAVLSLPARA